MVATQHEKILGVLNLVRKEEADALKTLRSAIYIVAQEKVIGLGREASVFEKAQQIGISATEHKHTILSTTTHDQTPATIIRSTISSSLQPLSATREPYCRTLPHNRPTLTDSTI